MSGISFQMVCCSHGKLSVDLYASATKWGGAYSFTLIRIYVSLSHFIALFLSRQVSYSIGCREFKLAIRFRYALNMCIKETKF